MDSPRKQFLQNESSWDEQVAALPAVGMQRQTIHTLLFNMIWMIRSGGLAGEGEPDPDKARALVGRLSLIADLLASTPFDRVYLSAWEATADARLDQVRALSPLLAYAHLCEIIPDVHRNNYLVSKRSTRTAARPVTGELRELPIYDLDFPSQEWAAVEALDIALSTVAMPLARPAPKASNRKLREACDGARARDLRKGTALSASFAAHYLRTVREVGTLSDAALAMAFGANTDGLARIRATLMGISEWGVQTSAWIVSRMKANGPTDDLAAELLDWTTMSLDRSWLLTVLAKTSGTPLPGVEALLDLFTLHESGSARSGGDGFMPPFVRLGSRLIFSPLVLQSSMSDRNIAYALNAIDADVFARTISAELEPKLLDDMRQILMADPALEVTTGIQWHFGEKRGEIDALITRPGDSSVLHVQAKGSIPPVGSRAVRHVETRVREGLGQCASFATLPRNEQEGIVAKALGRPIEDLTVVPLVLVRTNFGTHRIWGEAGTTSLATLPLIRATVRAQMKRDAHVTPALFATDLAACIDELQIRCAPTFGHEFADLDWVGVNLPVINMDQDQLMQLAVEWS